MNAHFSPASSIAEGNLVIMTDLLLLTKMEQDLQCCLTPPGVASVKRSLCLLHSSYDVPSVPHCLIFG